MKKKKVIITVCVVLIVLVRIYTPYLGKPFLIYCRGGGGSKERFYLSSDVKKILQISSHDSCVKFIRYCSNLEELTVLGYPETFNIKDISNPNLKKLDMSGYGVNWSSLNNCTELEDLSICFGDFNTTEDISELKNLEKLSIIKYETDISLNKLNEVKSLKELKLICLDEIDCADLSQLENLETLYLGADESMSSTNTKLKNTHYLNELKNVNKLYIRCQNDINCEDFAKLENVETLSLDTDGKIIGDEICGMDSLKEITIHKTKLSEKVESTLREKGVTIKYID